MTDREFRVPTDLEILEVLGVEPESSEEDPTVRVVRVERGEEDVVELSYDPPGRSVRCRWYRGSTMVMDLFREGATLLRVETQEDTARFVVDVATDSLAGELLVQVHPAVTVEDRLLLQ